MNQFTWIILATVLAVAASRAFANDSSFVAGGWGGKAYFDKSGVFEDCSAYEILAAAQQPGHGIMIKLSANQEVALAVFKTTPRDFIAPVTSRNTITLMLDGREIGKKKFTTLTKGFVIRLGKERPLVAQFTSASALSIDTGVEILEYSLRDIAAVFKQLDKCVADSAPAFAGERVTSNSDTANVSADHHVVQKKLPGPHELPPDSVGVEALIHASNAFCVSNPVLALYRPELSRKPTSDERKILLQNAQYMNDCIPVWRTQCSTKNDPSIPGLNHLCELYAEATKAFIANARSVATSEISFQTYNSRSEQIEQARVSTEQALFKISTDYVSELEKAAQQRDSLSERREEARREDEMIGLLRQISSQPSRQVITNCVGASDGTTVQCQSY